ncbi:hypothetical protein EDB89DRAFT_1904413 [Lactarius sanguifluus]|nr:hypothetical protein EDB89DRAFT_1904413 [Lactarius sanguifluus]
MAGGCTRDTTSCEKEKEKWTIQTAQNFKDSEVSALARKERGFQAHGQRRRRRKWAQVERNGRTPYCTHASDGDLQHDPYLAYPVDGDVGGTQLNTPRMAADHRGADQTMGWERTTRGPIKASQAKSSSAAARMPLLDKAARPRPDGLPTRSPRGKKGTDCENSKRERPGEEAGLTVSEGFPEKARTHASCVCLWRRPQPPQFSSASPQQQEKTKQNKRASRLSATFTKMTLEMGEHTEGITHVWDFSYGPAGHTLWDLRICFRSRLDSVIQQG